MNDLDNIRHKFCVAPMMDKTDRHCRYFHRLMSNRAFLYTEMLHSNAVIRGNKERLLKYNPKEHPLAIQLGGCDPVQLGEASAISEEFGYTEVNLNVGCPSSKVQKGKFGAVLMKEPKLVASCINQMKKSITWYLSILGAISRILFLFLLMAGMQLEGQLLDFPVYGSIETNYLMKRFNGNQIGLEVI